MPKASFTLDGDVGEIVIADPPLNLFGLELSRDLARAAGEARDSAARAVLIRAEGDNFSAGANVEMFLDRDEAAARELIEEFLPVIRSFAAIEVPTVAAVQGFCLAAGLEVALSCDLIWAAEGTQLGLVEAVMTRGLARRQALATARLETSLTRERIDVTMPGRRPRSGHRHPITLLRERLEDVFVALGYAIEDDREIETDFYNFTALNIPDNHPARGSADTFYTTDGFALRSQTSTVQIHAMQRRGVPVRMIAPGRVFRRDTPDPTHNPMFYQVEGLCVDRGITMAHLKGTVGEFLRRMFGPDTVTRFRPSYFPFTEPSAEFDFSCFK